MKGGGEEAAPEHLELPPEPAKAAAPPAPPPGPPPQPADPAPPPAAQKPPSSKREKDETFTNFGTDAYALHGSAGLEHEQGDLMGYCHIMGKCASISEQDKHCPHYERMASGKVPRRRSFRHVSATGLDEPQMPQIHAAQHH